MTNEQLLSIAAKSPPPVEWYDEEIKDLFAGARMKRFFKRMVVAVVGKLIEWFGIWK